MSLTIKWNGTDVLTEEEESNWVRALGKDVIFGSMQWQVPVTEASGWGSFVAGEGVPQAREVGFLLHVDMVNPSVPANLLYETQAKWDLLCAQFRPTVTPVFMEVTRSDGGDQTITRSLMVRSGGIYSWSQNTQGDGAAGARLTGNLRFPIMATAHYPWWIEGQDQVTGSNTALSATLTGKGDRGGGWRAKFRCPAGQTAGITAIGVTINGTLIPFVWQTGVTWAEGDEVVIEHFYPLSNIWAGGMVTYIIKASGVIQNYGVLSPTLTGVTSLATTPTDGSFDVSIAITGLNANGLSFFDWATLHGSF